MINEEIKHATDKLYHRPRKTLGYRIPTHTDEWYASIGNNTLADATLDRLMHNAHRLQLKGVVA